MQPLTVFFRQINIVSHLSIKDFTGAKVREELSDVFIHLEAKNFRSQSFSS